jgi:Uma2 family endonuclease
MQETMVHPPRTIMEVFKMLPQGTLAEVIENTLYMSPTPTGKHQWIIAELLSKLKAFASEKDLGIVLPLPLDVYLDRESNAVQPDLFFISKSNLGIFHEDGPVEGVPDLIVEVLSPGNTKHDKVRKKDLYEKFGVKEYWIVDPSNKKTLGYSLVDNKFISLGEFQGELVSALLKQSFIF